MKLQRLTPEFVEGFRRAVMAPEGDALILAMQRLTTTREVRPEDERPLALARELGWIVQDRLTFDGQRAADALREYAYWDQRDRQMVPAEAHEAQHRVVQDMKDRRVLEVGCGFGVNGLYAQGQAASFTGIDLEIGYLQLSPILQEKSGVGGLRLACAPAEAMPFASNSFDYVLCLAVLQYTRPAAAIAEMARVLAPGGRLNVVTGSFGQGLLTYWDSKRWLRQPRSLVGEARTIANTLTLQTLGKKWFLSRRPSATSSAAHVTRGHVRRCLVEAGLRPLEVTGVSRYDTLYYAEKPTSPVLARSG